MSVVIVGGNECMASRDCQLCREYSCKAKCYPKFTRGVQDLGAPDLLVLFTGTMSHKMLRSVLSTTKGQNIPIARCQSSSMAALRRVLELHAPGGPAACPAQGT